MPVLPALEKQRQETEFRVILSYIMNQANLGYVRPCFKKKYKNTF